MPLRVSLLLTILAALVAGHGGAFSSEPRGEDWTVIDGDTLQVDGAVIQLYGIDAPELGQLCDSNGDLWHCGMEAAFALRKLVILNEASLHCSPWNKDGEGVADPPPATTLRVCEAGDEDLAEVMLHNGHSLSLPGAFPDYIEAEEQARQAGLGLWHSDFVPPWAWRAGVAALDRPSDSTRECNIKGVVNADGQRLYYVPSDAEYQAITIDEARGEALFCSDDEARSAGWRHTGETARVDK